MLNRTDIKNIIISEPENAHNIIADKLNDEKFWAILVILGVTVGIVFVSFMIMVADKYETCL